MDLHTEVAAQSHFATYSKNSCPQCSDWRRHGRSRLRSLGVQ
jgi:hypothetical protein